MVAQTIGLACTADHVRPFSLTRDLAALADLLQTAFADDLASTGSHMVEEMRQMAALGPLLHLARFTTPPLRGLVYVHEGRLVGNISLAREKDGRWVLSNVAVTPDMRGQGIAGCLVDAALEQIRRRRGRVVTLQVRSDNPVAIALYAHRGFCRYDTVHEMLLPRSSWPIVLRDGPDWVRPPRWTDAPHLEQLRLACLPDAARPYTPCVQSTLPQSAFLRWVRWAWQALSQGQERVALVAAPEGIPVALASVALRLFASAHELELLVAPSHRGRVEEPLLGGLFARLRAAPRRDIRITLSASHAEGIAALMRLGFRTQRVLDQMGQLLAAS